MASIVVREVPSVEGSQVAAGDLDNSEQVTPVDTEGKLVAMECLQEATLVLARIAVVEQNLESRVLRKVTSSVVE